MDRWDDYVNNFRKEMAPKEVKEISEVDWTTVSQEALENDTFSEGDPFYLVGPRELWGEVQDSNTYEALCKCYDFTGNPIPNCIPTGNGSPFVFLVCINIANPKQFNLSRGRKCIEQGPDWYELSTHFFCA